jgi:perosamine synthetase
LKTQQNGRESENMNRRFTPPPRHQFGLAERQAVLDALDYYMAQGKDFGTQGHFENLYTRSFVKFQGPSEGHCDAVSSGTAALYVALKSLNLEKNSPVLVSPITDPGCISAIILSDLVPKLVDTAPGLYNPGLRQIQERLDEDIKALVLVHSSGSPARDIGAIADLCRAKGVRLIEDCSQSHGAIVDGQRVGTFGDIAAFSTMNTKNHSSGGCGGLTYTRSKALHDLIRMNADRGKPFHDPTFDPKNPACFAFPALNFSQDELSCAIGLATLAKLDTVRKRRVSLLKRLERRLEESSASCRLTEVTDDDSPFFWPIRFDSMIAGCSKELFTRALLEAGLPINPHYRYMVNEWPWAREYLGDTFPAENAKRMIESSFNLLFHEGFRDEDMDIIADVIIETENAFTVARADSSNRATIKSVSR